MFLACSLIKIVDETDWMSTILTRIDCTKTNKYYQTFGPKQLRQVHSNSYQLNII